MSDWKSLMVAFVTEDEIPDEIAEHVLDEPINSVLSDAHNAGLMREFDTVSFDYLVFLDPFLSAYNLPECSAFKKTLARRHDVELQLLPASSRTDFRNTLSAFATHIQNIPEIAARVIRADDQKMFNHWASSADKTTDPFMREKNYASLELYRKELLDAPIDGERMLQLWNINKGRGYFHGSYPEAAELLFTNRPCNLLSAAFQTFGYIKAMQKWCDEAGDRAILEIIW